MTTGRMVRCLLLVGLVLPAHPAVGVAQVALFDPWVVQILSDSRGLRDAEPWAVIPRSPAVPDSSRLRAAVHLRALRLGRTALFAATDASVRWRAPLGATGHRLRFGVLHRTGTIDGGNGPLLDTRRTGAFTAGLDLRRSDPRWGTWSIEGTTAWNGAASWALDARGASGYHTVRVSRWRTGSQQLRFTLPTAAVTNVSAQHLETGWLGTLGLRLPAPGPFRVIGAVEREEHDLRENTDATGAFLLLSSPGTTQVTAVQIGLEAWGRAGVSWRRLTRASGLEGSFQRAEAQAGRLFFARWNLTRWVARGWIDVRADRWSVAVGRDSLDGALAVRMETWPFVPLWEQLGAIAFRYRGFLDGTATWTRIERGSPAGDRSLGVSIAFYDFGADVEDWLVTSLGFGRDQERATTWDIESLVFVGVAWRHPFLFSPGRLSVSASVVVPVFARASRVGDHAPPNTGSDLAGQLELGATWTW